MATETARAVIGSEITYCQSAFQALEGADGLLVVTEWNEFRHPDLQQIKKMLKQPVIFDGRNIYNPAEMKKMGFTYYGIGRGKQI